MYPIIYFEISGKCNALCPWCATGRKNRQHIDTGGFIKPELFEKALDRLQEIGLLSPQTVIKLFSWGEPFLHPQFKEIVEILNKKELSFGLSTNASRPVFFDQPLALRNLREIIISMSGFSQKSYSRAHGFNFEKIISNITNMMQNFRQCGFRGIARISYHIYQFNMHEIEPAILFARQNGIILDAGLAYIADWEEYRNYLCSEMDYEKLKLASQNLFLFHINEKKEELRNSGLPVSSCPQFNFLNIDEECNVLTCCLVDKSHKDYSIGSIFDLTTEEIVAKKRCQSICSECHELGIWYLIQSPVKPKQIFTLCD